MSLETAGKLPHNRTRRPLGGSADLADRLVSGQHTSRGLRCSGRRDKGLDRLLQVTTHTAVRQVHHGMVRTVCLLGNSLPAYLVPNSCICTHPNCYLGFSGPRTNGLVNDTSRRKSSFLFLIVYYFPFMFLFYFCFESYFYRKLFMDAVVQRFVAKNSLLTCFMWLGPLYTHTSVWMMNIRLPSQLLIYSTMQPSTHPNNPLTLIMHALQYLPSSE